MTGSDANVDHMHPTVLTTTTVVVVSTITIDRSSATTT